MTIIRIAIQSSFLDILIIGIRITSRDWEKENYFLVRYLPLSYPFSEYLFLLHVALRQNERKRERESERQREMKRDGGRERE